jgi:hypothetical protein
VPRLSASSPWAIAAWTIPIFGVLAVALGGIRTGYSAKSIVLWAITGVAIGGMLVPDTERGSVRSPALWQMACGLVAGIFIGLVLGGGAAGALVGAMAGALMGYFAPLWLNNFSF